MKRLASLLLCVSLLLTLAPGALAAEPEDQPELYEPERVEEEYDGPVLMSDGDGGTVTVTIRLPEGASMGNYGRCVVALYRPPVLSDGVVKKTPTSARSKNVTAENGVLETTFEGVAPGQYFFHVTPYVNSPLVLGEMQYFHGDGTPARDQYSAVPFTLGEGDHISRTLTLAQADTYISGTVTFTDAMTTERTLTVRAQEMTHTGKTLNCTSRVRIPAGAKSADFVVGVRGDSASLCLRGNAENQFVGVDGLLGAKASARAYYDLTHGPVTGLRLSGDGLYEETNTVTVTLNITLPAPATRDQELMIGVAPADNASAWEDSLSEMLVPGQQTVSAAFDLDPERSWAFSCIDLTKGGSVSFEPLGCWYIAPEGGVTGIPDKAASFTFTEETTIDFTFPASYALTGTLDRGEYTAIEGYGYAIAMIGEETFSARVVFPEGQQTGDFTIYVPKTLAGETAEIHTVRAEDDSIPSEDDSFPAIKDLELTGDLALGTLALPADTVERVTVSGTISLPAGVTAPRGGVSVQLSMSDPFYLVIPEGENALTFTLDRVPAESIPFASLITPLDGVFFRTDVGYIKENEPIELTFSPEVVVSGTVRLPAGVTTGYCADISTSIRGNATVNVRVSIPYGSRSTNYRLYLPEGSTLRELRLSAPNADTTKSLISKQYYIGVDWVQQDASETLELDGDKSGVDFLLEAAEKSAGVTRLYTDSGSDDLVQRIKNGETLKADVDVTGLTEGMTLRSFAALYDQDGAFIGLAADDAAAEDDATLQFSFADAKDASSVKVFVMDEDFAPVGTHGASN